MTNVITVFDNGASANWNISCIPGIEMPDHCLRVLRGVAANICGNGGALAPVPVSSPPRGLPILHSPSLLPLTPLLSDLSEAGMVEPWDFIVSEAEIVVPLEKTHPRVPALASLPVAIAFTHFS